MTKYTIPAGYDFSEGVRTGHAAAFFAWLAANSVDPAQIDPKQDAVVTRNEAGWSLTATTLVGGTGTWPLFGADAAVAEWLDATFGVKTAAVDDIKSRLDRLADARARERAAHDEAEELRAEILGVLTARGASIGLVEGQPVIQKKAVPMTKLNRKALEAEYPTIAARFITEYEQIRLEFL